MLRYPALVGEAFCLAEELKPIVFSRFWPILISSRLPTPQYKRLQRSFLQVQKHTWQVAQLSIQTIHLLAQIFAAGCQALAAGLHTSFLAILGISIATLLLTLFLKDIPLHERTPEARNSQNPSATNTDRALPHNE